MVSEFGEEQVDQMYCHGRTLGVDLIKAGEKVNFEATEVPVISTGLKNKYIEKVKNSYPHVEKLWFSDVSDREVLEVHLLFGSEYLRSFHMENIVRGKCSEPVAIETKLDYVLSGPLKGVAEEERLLMFI